MTFIESSIRSPLSGVAELGEPPERPAEQSAEPEDAPDEDERRPRRRGARRFLVRQIGDINLARYMDPVDLDALGQQVVREYEIDERSRADWLERTTQALKYATQVTEEKQYPWPKASNIVWPLICEASLQFGARTYPALVPGKNVVRGIIWGEDRGTPMTEDGKPDGKPKLGPDGQPQWLVAPGEKRQRADRIGEHMSWQLLEQMPEWEPQTDQLLHQIPITGGCARKTYFDPVLRRTRSLMVQLTNLVWNYWAPSFEAAPRHTEKILLYPYEIATLERTGATADSDGAFIPLNYAPASTGEGEGVGLDEAAANVDTSDPDAPHLFLEQHRRLDLDDDDYEEPYIVTVHRRSGKVVRIVANYEASGITVENGEVTRVEQDFQYTLIPFLPNIDGGSYPMGFGHLLRPINEAINSTLNQMFDAGHLQNAGGGFISDQLGVHSGNINFSVGKYVRVNAKGQSIRDSVFPLPFNGPSATLFQLLGLIMQAGEKVASIQDILAGDAAIANAPPTTILALIEQGMKLYTAIHKRVYRAFKAEFAKIFALNRRNLTAPERYKVGDEWREATPEDYRLGGGVEPVADPAMLTDMQKIGRANVLMMFKDDPTMNAQEIKTRLLEAVGVDRIGALFLPPNPQAAQMAAINAQLEFALKQAELGRARAAELKDQTQAFLNLAMARAKATEPEEDFIEKQLDFLRLHIESINTQVKAAAVDANFHATNARQIRENASEAAAMRPLDTAPAPAAPAAPRLQPEPTGPFPASPTGPPAGGGGPASGPGGPASVAPSPPLPAPAAALSELGSA